MAYTRINWQDGPSGGTPLSAANLNHMDQGIADAHAEVDALDPSVRFQVSGCVGGNTNITLPPGHFRRLQIVSLAVPSGKSLILKRARFDMINDLRLQIDVGFDPSVIWRSESDRGDVTLDVLVSNAISLTPVWVQAFNPTDGSVDLQPFAGWWLDFAIVDA